MKAFAAMWQRVLVLLMIALCIAVRASAQAPPPAFFVGRSNEDLHALATDPRNDVLLRRTAATKLVTNLADAGAFDAADAAGREFSKNIDPRALAHARAVRRRHHAHLIAIGVLGAPLALAAVALFIHLGRLSVAWRATQRLVPVATLFVVYSGLVGGYLASSYENSSALPFVFFALLMFPMLLLLRVWSAVGSPRLSARFARALLAVAGTVALGFLVVEQVNPAYLEGIGL